MECCLIHFFPHVPILYPLNRSQKQCFQGDKIGTIGRNDLITKYNNKLVCTCLDLLTFKIILLF